jgi:tetratricopeptide (TPR) repeat protein
LATANPDAYISDVAQTLNNLALLHNNTNRYEQAEQDFQEALEIRRKLATVNPTPTHSILPRR